MFAGASCRCSSTQAGTDTGLALSQRALRLPRVCILQRHDPGLWNVAGCSSTCTDLLWKRTNSSLSVCWGGGRMAVCALSPLHYLGSAMIFELKKEERATFFFSWFQHKKLRDKENAQNSHYRSTLRAEMWLMWFKKQLLCVYNLHKSWPVAATGGWVYLSSPEQDPVLTHTHAHTNIQMSILPDFWFLKIPPRMRLWQIPVIPP